MTGWDDHLSEPTPQNKIFTYPLYGLQTIGSLQQLVLDILNSNAIAVSDGSFHPELQLGTASWIIESNNTQHKLTGNIVTSGPKDIQNPYRSELFGIFRTLIVFSRRK